MQSLTLSSLRVITFFQRMVYSVARSKASPPSCAVLARVRLLSFIINDTTIWHPKVKDWNSQSFYAAYSHSIPMTTSRDYTLVVGFVQLALLPNWSPQFNVLVAHHPHIGSRKVTYLYSCKQRPDFPTHILSDGVFLSIQQCCVSSFTGRDGDVSIVCELCYVNPLEQI